MNREKKDVEKTWQAEQAGGKENNLERIREKKSYFEMAKRANRSERTNEQTNRIPAETMNERARKVRCYNFSM